MTGRWGLAQAMTGTRVCRVKRTRGAAAAFWSPPPSASVAAASLAVAADSAAW